MEPQIHIIRQLIKPGPVRGDVCHLPSQFLPSVRGGMLCERRSPRGGDGQHPPGLLRGAALTGKQIERGLFAEGAAEESPQGLVHGACESRFQFFPADRAAGFPVIIVFAGNVSPAEHPGALGLCFQGLGQSAEIEEGLKNGLLSVLGDQNQKLAEMIDRLPPAVQKLVKVGI